MMDVPDRSAAGALLRRASYLYDADARLQAVQGADGRTRARYTYDRAGRLQRVTDGRDQSTELAYGPLGQLLRLTQPGAGVTRYHYDDQQRLSGLTDARANTTRYARDDFGHLVRRDSPDTGTTRYRYDPGRRSNPKDRRPRPGHRLSP